MSHLLTASAGGNTQFPIPVQGHYTFLFKYISDPEEKEKTYNGVTKTINQVYIDFVPQGDAVEWICDDDIEIRPDEQVRMYFNFTLGTDEKHSKLSEFVEAILGSHGEVLDRKKKYDLAGYQGTLIQGGVKHWTKNTGKLGADIVGPIPVPPAGATTAGRTARRASSAPATPAQAPAEESAQAPRAPYIDPTPTVVGEAAQAVATQMKEMAEIVEAAPAQPNW